MAPNTAAVQKKFFYFLKSKAGILIVSRNSNAGFNQVLFLQEKILHNNLSRTAFAKS